MTSIEYFHTMHNRLEQIAANCHSAAKAVISPAVEENLRYAAIHDYLMIINEQLDNLPKPPAE